MSDPFVDHEPGDNAPGLPLLDLNVYGSTGLHRWDGYIAEEDHPRLAGRKAMRVFREMSENDATVGAAMYVIRALTQGIEFRFDPANESAEAREVQAFVESCFEDMSHTWDDFLSEVNSALEYGFAPFERVYKLRQGPTAADPRFRSKFNDGRIGIRKLAIRAQTSLEKWEFDEGGGLRGMWQLAPPDYRRTFIPIEKLVLYRPRAPLNNPEGRSILRSAYRSWFLLKRLQELEAIGLERDLAGLPVMQVPVELMLANATPDQKALRRSFELLVQKVRRDEREGLVVPAEEQTDEDGTIRKSGYKFGLVTSGGRRALDIRPAIESYERAIARTMLAEFIFLGTDPNGSRSLADSKTTTFASALGAWVDNIVATTQRYVIDPLVQMNGWPVELSPQLVAGDIETPDLEAAATYVTGLVSSGLLTPDTDLERHLRALAKLPELDATRVADVGMKAPPVPGAPLTVTTLPPSPPSPPGAQAGPQTAPTGAPAPGAATPAPVPEEKLADTALNGAQVAAIIDVAERVQKGTLPLGSARALLRIAFRLSDADIADVLGPLQVGSIPPDPAPPAHNPPGTPAPPAPPPPAPQAG